MPRKASKKTMRKKCDILWSKLVRANGECVMCGKPGPLNAHHIQGRTSLAVRYNLENGLCLCVGCHFIAHHKQVTFSLWLQEYLGSGLLEKLHELDKPTYGKFDYQETFEYLTKLYKDLDEDF